MSEYPVSVVTNIITWPSVSAGIAMGPLAGALCAFALGAIVAKAARH